MSTRGSFGFIKDNEVELFYNNYDSYPVGLGKSILDFIVKSNLECKWNIYQESGNYLFEELYSYFDEPSKDYNFIKNSLFCEYAYIINLDNMTLEFYNGFQKKPQIGNRFGSNLKDGYYPCRLVCIFNLTDINDFIDVDNILAKMDTLIENDEDDISVEKYFRKIKLEKLNEKAS